MLSHIIPVADFRLLIAPVAATSGLTQTLSLFRTYH
ncbi:hypothetical protein EPYR_03181 [Erwinia pyrifoliae DSM 12163]|nr:hypothetical protein EPYR_03181 [Erwinia pyrifoliae DSM 12163]